MTRNTSAISGPAGTCHKRNSHASKRLHDERIVILRRVKRDMGAGTSNRKFVIAAAEACDLHLSNMYSYIQYVFTKEERMEFGMMTVSRPESTRRSAFPHDLYGRFLYALWKIKGTNIGMRTVENLATHVGISTDIADEFLKEHSDIKGLLYANLRFEPRIGDVRKSDAPKVRELEPA